MSIRSAAKATIVNKDKVLLNKYILRIGTYPI